jgi:hypothetical protein
MLIKIKKLLFQEMREKGISVFLLKLKKKR